MINMAINLGRVDFDDQYDTLCVGKRSECDEWEIYQFHYDKCNFHFIICILCGVDYRRSSSQIPYVTPQPIAVIEELGDQIHQLLSSTFRRGLSKKVGGLCKKSP